MGPPGSGFLTPLVSVAPQDICKQATEDRLTSANELPYFEGDFWPNVLEESIKELEQEEEERKREENSTSCETPEVKKRRRRRGGGREMGRLLCLCFLYKRTPLYTHHTHTHKHTRKGRNKGRFCIGNVCVISTANERTKIWN